MEILIAFSVFALSAGAILLIEAGVNDAAEATLRHADMLAIADYALAKAMSSEADIAERVELNGTTYVTTMTQSALTACMSSFEASVSRERYMFERRVYKADVEESMRLGGDCLYRSYSDLGIPHDYGSVAGEEGSAIDTLDSHIYIGTDKPPYLRIHEDVEYVAFTNGFSLHARPAALDVVHYPGGEEGMRTIIFAALETSTGQLAVIDASDASEPLLVATSTLAGVVPSGSAPGGHRIFYYDGRVFISTLETAGPELHVFSVADPEHPTEIGAGYSINITLNDFSIQDDRLYAATARDTGEIAVYQISDTGTLAELTMLRTDLPGSQDGESIAVIADMLYLGRASNTAGPELYTYRIDDESFTQLGSAEIPSVSITGVRVVGDRAYLAATPSGVSTRRLEIYDVSNPSSMERIDSRSIPGLAPRGIDVAPGGVYAVSTRDPILRLLPSN